MAFAEPHVGMERCLRDAVAVGRQLRFVHELAHALRAQEFVVPRLEYGRFEQVARVDVADDLARVGQLALDQRQLLLFGFRAVNGLAHHQHLVEGGRGLRHRHRVILLYDGIAEHLLVVERVAQFVRESDDISERPVEVGQHAALLRAGHAAVERAAHFAFAREEIDPVLLKRALDHVVQIRVEVAENVQQVFFGLFHRVFAVQRAQRREHVAPGQSVAVSQRAAFRLEVFTEFGHVVVHGGDQRVQRLAAHAGIVQRLVEGRRESAQAAFVQHLQLDAVQGKRGGLLDLRITGQLRFVRVFAHRGIAVVGQVAGRGQCDILSPVLYINCAGQRVVQLLPRRRAGNIHQREYLLFLFGQQIPAVFFDLPQEKRVILQRSVAFDLRLQILHAADRLLYSGLGRGDVGEHCPQPAHQRGGLHVGGIGGVHQVGVAEELFGQVADAFLDVNIPVQQIFVRYRAGDRGQLPDLFDRARQAVNVRRQRRVVKSVIQYAEVPAVITALFHEIVSSFSKIYPL